MSKNPEKAPPLEQGLITAMQAIDNQIAREMLRSPSELDEHGVQKWEPFMKRIESVSVLVLNALGEQEIQLDSILVLAQALSKSLQLVIEDLGQEGLGNVRTDYCLSALDKISKDMHRALQFLNPDECEHH